MPVRKLGLTWEKLEEVLQKADYLPEEEYLKRITLVKPHKILLIVEKKTGTKEKEKWQSSKK